MAVSSVSTFFSAFLPSNSSNPPPTSTSLHFLPSQLRLQQSSSRSSSLVSACDLAEQPSPSFSSLHATDHSHILYPALAYSNILFFNSAYNVQVIVKEDEPEDVLVNRFRKEVLKAGVFQECRRRRFFECQQDKRKRKSREAAKKNRRRSWRPQSRVPIQNKDGAPKKEKYDDENDDNWELPDVDLPYS